MFRRALLASVGAIALTGSAAFAADLPYRGPPPVFVPPPPLFTWTGLYLGINAGYTWSNSNNVDTDTTNVFSIGGLNGNIGGEVAALGTGDVPVQTNGFIGGGQIGYNWQINNFVLGFETDIQGVAGANRTGSLAQSGVVPGSIGIGGVPVSASSVITSTKDINYLGTVRGRLGFTLTPTFLVYGTGGLAYGGVSSSTNISETLGFPDTPAFGTFGNFSQSRVGWTAGGGLEWLFAPNWSLKVEYLYYDLGRATFALAPLQQFSGFGTILNTIGASSSSTRFSGNIIRGGLNYHFNLFGPAPVVAKY